MFTFKTEDWQKYKEHQVRSLRMCGQQECKRSRQPWPLPTALPRQIGTVQDFALGTCDLSLTMACGLIMTYTYCKYDKEKGQWASAGWHCQIAQVTRQYTVFSIYTPNLSPNNPNTKEGEKPVWGNWKCQSIPSTFIARRPLGFAATMTWSSISFPLGQAETWR